MSAHPRRVLATGYITWPPGASVPTHVKAGSVVDIPPGSALEAAYGVLGLDNVSSPQLGRGETLDKSFLSN